MLTLVAVDLSKPLPSPFQLDELRPYCAHLTWDAAQAQLAWDDADFGRYPLLLDPPPSPEFATRQIQKVGAAAKDAKRVEVPVRIHRSRGRRLVDARQPRGHRRSTRQGRRDQTPALHARAWHVAARS